MLILLGLAGNDLVQQAWKVRARFIAQEYQILPQHFMRGAKLPNSSNSGKLQPLACHLLNGSLWGERLKTSALQSIGAGWHFGISISSTVHPDI